MLKLIYIFLLVYSNLSSASDLLKLNSDTTKIVYIKVLVREKPIVLEHSPSAGVTDSNLSSKSPSFKSLSPNKTNPVRLPKALKAEIINSDPQSKKNLNRKSQPILEKEVFNQIRSPQKNKHLFISLLLIVTGTIVALFYRSGIPLIFAILLMITGYYLFIYAMLFMV